MPQFFQKDSLTEKQKQNWDFAISAYEHIMQKNIDVAFNYLTKSDKEELISQFKIQENNPENLEKLLYEKYCSFYKNIYNQPGDNKSALFFRLLEGEKPLIYPPPTSMSYPDYSFLESQERIPFAEVNEDIFFKKNEFVKYPHIIINQTPWKVVNKINKNHYEVTFGKWEDEGFLWDVKLVEIHTKECSSFIVSHHDKIIDRITTLKQLEQECIHQTKEHFRSINIYLHTEEKEKYRQELKHYPSNFVEAFVQQKYDAGKSLLESRIRENKKQFPNDDEIHKYALDMMERNYLKFGYFSKNGDLYKKCWTIQAKNFKLEDKHYIDVDFLKKTHSKPKP